MLQHQEELFNKLLNGELSAGEAEILVSWLGSGKLDPAAEALVSKQLSQTVSQRSISPGLRAALEKRLPDIVGRRAPVVLFQKRWLRFAAVIVIFLGTGLLFLWPSKPPISKVVSTVKSVPFKVKDVQPGHEGAVLTLADGRIIVLDSLKNGIVATQSGSKIVLANGQLMYDKNHTVQKEAAYNAITTPRGRQFQIVLSDGTQVWLNAASSLRYPIAFTGKERKVEMSGEAYFEVAENPHIPFRVSVNGATAIEVLGTHFNVNSYHNEAAISTTLLEGSVKIYHNAESIVIKPGQQVQTASSDSRLKLKVLSGVNMAKVMAWKNGVFDFENASLGEVMRQLERWYDVEVVYEKGIPSLEFYGRMERELTLSNVLRGLEMSKVHFRLEDKKLVVLP